MRQRNKAALIIALTGFIYLALDFFMPDKDFLFLITLTILSSLITFLAIYSVIIKRVEQLNRKVIAMTKKNALSTRLKFSGTDEVGSISSHTNTLLDNIQADILSLTQQIRIKNQELFDKNIQLEKEISVKSHSQKLIIDRDYLMKLCKKNDELTSLPNGIQFNEILNKALVYSKRRNKILAVLLINLDLFKLVYDNFGRENCDLILKEISKRLQNTLRKEDILAKLDGDEFIVLLNDINQAKFASMAAEKILNSCSQLLKVDSHEFTITASIGISVFPNDGNSLEELIENADRALFMAKQSGGNTYQYYANEIHLEAIEYIQLESALRKAIQNNELALYYQPKFRINTGHITGVEALMRWENPTLGMLSPTIGIISPTRIIQLAEESGQIMQIGEWALQEACQRIKYWKNEGFEHITIALKLSPKQFNHPDLIKMLTKVLANSNINPKYIELEITEQTVMENAEAAGIILENIKATGVQISIDHFGTGYTVIGYLKKFPISSIKIDQSYIKGIPNKPNDIAITSALIALAHKLGLEVVAEGVETAEQVKFLSAQGCDILQGYFLSHPVSAQKIVLQLRKLQDEVLG